MSCIHEENPLSRTPHAREAGAREEPQLTHLYSMSTATGERVGRGLEPTGENLVRNGLPCGICVVGTSGPTLTFKGRRGAG